MTTSTQADRIAELIANGYEVRIEPCPRRIRAFFGGEAIVDTTRAVYLFETRHVPVYYVPFDDVRGDLVEPTSHTSRCPFKGEADYLSIVVGARRSENAIWRYREPIESCPDISGHVAFFWDRVDSWFEEDEEVFVHARDPYHRVDVLDSSRHVEVYVAGQKVADSRRPRLAFETGLPTRYYLPKLDVDMGRLQPSDHATTSPYLGAARWWSIGPAQDRTGDDETSDVAWTYAQPVSGAEKLANLVAFAEDKVERIVVDGEDQPLPRRRETR
jgi:uncharacterized protein (DUF427 family)